MGSIIRWGGGGGGGEGEREREMPNEWHLIGKVVHGHCVCLFFVFPVHVWVQFVSLIFFIILSNVFICFTHILAAYTRRCPANIG